jgi:chromosome segregation ATPase
VTKKATGSCALLEKRLTKASAELAAESEQRVVLEERVNKLLIVNEDHRHMIEILEQEADTLRSGYSTMKDYYDKMMKQRDRIRASFLEQSITIDKMLATRSEMSVLSAEKEILEIECEISDTENRRLVQQLESTRVASEDMKERTKTLNNGVLSLSSENDNLRNELEKASASETEVDTLRTECNGKRMKFDEFMNESIGKLITCSGDFSGEETMLVTRNQIEILPEETEVGNKCYEVAARESNMSGAQVGEFGSAGEGTDLSEERLREAVVTLSSAKQVRKYFPSS